MDWPLLIWRLQPRGKLSLTLLEMQKSWKHYFLDNQTFCKNLLTMHILSTSKKHICICSTNTNLGPSPKALSFSVCALQISPLSDCPNSHGLLPNSLDCCRMFRPQKAWMPCMHCCKPRPLLFGNHIINFTRLPSNSSAN